MKGNNCPLCDGRMKRKKVPYSYAGVTLGSFAADVCGKCGELFFTPEAWSSIERLAKKKGLWGTGRRVKVGYSGHSLVLRIPGSIATVSHIRQGNTVYLQPAGKGRLLVEKEPNE